MTYGLEIPEFHDFSIFELHEQVVLGSQLKEELGERGLGGIGLGGGEDRLEARGHLQLKGLEYRDNRNVRICSVMKELKLDKLSAA